MYPHFFSLWAVATVNKDSLLTHDDAYVVSGSEDGKVFFWDLVDAEVVKSFQVNESGAALTALAWHPQGEMLLTAKNKGDIAVWNCCTGGM